MKKNMLIRILIPLMILLASIQGAYADGLSLKRVDTSVLKSLDNFNVTDLHPPYMDALKPVKYIDKNSFAAKVREISLRLYSGKAYDPESKSYEKPGRYYLEIYKTNTSVLYEFENIRQIQDIMRIRSGGMYLPIRLQATVTEPPEDDGTTVGSPYPIYEIGLRFEDTETLSLESLNIVVSKLPQIPVFISTVVTHSEYNRMLGRAIVYEQYEAPSFMVVELFEPTGPFPEHTKASKRIDVCSNELTCKEYRRLSGESSYGGGPSNVEWDGLTLRYKVGVGKKRFSCALNGLDENNFDSYCHPDVR